MEIRTEIKVHGSPEAGWTVLGQEFGRIDRWASAISSSTLDRDPAVGAVRTCRLTGFGGLPPSEIAETVIHFDPEGRSLAYTVTSGLPSFIRAAENHWSVRSIGGGFSLVTSSAKIRVAWYFWPFIPALRARMRKDVERLLEELKHTVEEGQPRSRKPASDAA